MRKTLLAPFLMIVSLCKSMAATETTVYYCIDVDNPYTVKLNVNRKGDGDDWAQYDMELVGTYHDKSVYKCTYTDLWDGVGVMQFQLYDGSNWKSQVVPIDNWTFVNVYNGKMYDGKEWVEYGEGHDLQSEVFDGNNTCTSLGTFSRHCSACDFELQRSATETDGYGLRDHVVIDESTRYLYFTCGYDANREYYWGDKAEGGEAHLFAYMWKPETVDEPFRENRKYPGVEMPQVGQNEFGEYVYKIPFDENYENIIFSDEDNHQTVNIQLTTAPLGYYITGMSEEQNYWEHKATVDVWDVRKAHCAVASDVHYYICNMCGKYFSLAHNLNDGCLECSRLELDNKRVPDSYAVSNETYPEYDVVMFNRTFKVGYSTLTLPFELSDTQFHAVFGNDASLYGFSSSEETENGTTLTFSAQEGLEANIPYILHVSTEVVAPEFRNVRVVNHDELTMSNNGWEMHGNYTTGLSMAGRYGVANNARIMKGGTNSTLNAYAAYLTAPSAGVAKEVTLLLSDDVSGTSTRITVEELDSDGESLFDILGRRSTGETSLRGIYIMGDRKVLKK